MDELTYRLLLVFADLVAPLIVGYCLRCWHIMEMKTCDKLILFNIIFNYTMLNLLSFWVVPLSPQVLLMPLYAALYMFFPAAIALWFTAKRLPDYLERGAYVQSAILKNLGTIGGVCAFILYSETGFAYAQIIGTCQAILLVLFAFPVAQYYYMKNKAASSQTKLRINLRQMFLTWKQFSLVGIVVGLALNIGGISRPEGTESIFAAVVHISAWIAMLPVGFLIDFHKAKKFYRKTMDLIPIHFIAVPLLSYIAAKPFFDDPVLINTILILSATPTAISAVSACQIYKLQVDLCVASFISTTAIYFVIVFPLLCLLL